MSALPVFIRWLLWSGFCALCLLPAHCAKQGVPTGGPKDTTPPRVVVERSSPNFVTHFSGNTISLTFDEWVTLSEVATQVFVSPPLTLKPIPEVTLRGKTVTVKFPQGEMLRPNTTYTIHFGTSIKDLHENNPAADLRYVFSTGPYIDSLRVAGQVRDVRTGKGVEKITVALYEETNDSVLRKQKPSYIGLTQTNGLFSIGNVRSGRYKVAAFEDQSKNLKWEEGNERIAFEDSLLVVRDTLTRLAPLYLFGNQPVARRPEAEARTYGLVRLRYTALPDSLPISTNAAASAVEWVQERRNDTLLIWYRTTAALAWNLYLGKDTVQVKALEAPATLAPVRFAEEIVSASSGKFSRTQAPAPGPATARPAPKVVPQLPSKSGILDFATPIVRYDTTKWLLATDSVPTRAFQVVRDSLLPRRLRLLTQWKAESSVLLTLLPGALTDLYGQSNRDTLQRIFSVPVARQLGSLNLTLSQLLPGTSYVLSIKEGEQTVEERRFRAGQASMRFIFTQLRPLTYSVQLVEDRNNNGRWDTGDYYRHRAPEPVYTRQLEPLRSNWEVEANMEAGYDPKKK